MNKKIIIIDGQENAEALVRMLNETGSDNKELLKILAEAGVLELFNSHSHCGQSNDQNQQASSNKAEEDNDGFGDTIEYLGMFDQAEDLMRDVRNMFESEVRSRMFIHLMRSLPYTYGHAFNQTREINVFEKMNAYRRMAYNLTKMLHFITQGKDEDLNYDMGKNLNELRALEIQINPILTMLKEKDKMLAATKYPYSTHHSADIERVGIINKMLNEAFALLNEVYLNIKGLCNNPMFNKFLRAESATVNDCVAYAQIMNQIINCDSLFVAAVNMIDKIKSLATPAELADPRGLYKQVNDLASEIHNQIQPLKSSVNDRFQIMFNYADTDITNGNNK